MTHVFLYESFLNGLHNYNQLKNAVVTQSARVFESKGKVGCSNPGRYRPKSLKQVVPAQLPNTLQ